MMAVAVAGHRQRVDRIHLIASRGQRPHPQPTIGFDADHHLIGFLSMLSDQLVQLADTGQPLRQAPRTQPLTGLIHQIHIVMLFSLVITHKDHQSLLDRLCGATTFEPKDTRRQPNGSVLNRHDIPPEL
jgi:hypothetical protein